VKTELEKFLWADSLTRFQPLLTTKSISLGLSFFLGLGRFVFTQKQGFGPRTAKSQPIWIKFCTHLLLSGIHLWADFDRGRRVGGSRLNQNDYVFL